MRNTKWMVACLLIGFVMASAMLSTIPIYMNASLQRMLVKDLEDFQLENNVYPGVYAFTATSIPLDTDYDTRMEYIEEKLAFMEERFEELGVKPESEKTFLVDDYDNIPSLTTSGGSKPSVKVGAMTNIADHISFSEGRMYETGMRDDGVYEVITTENALKISGLTSNTVYEVANSFDTHSLNRIKIEIVGIFTVKDPNDSYWSEGMDATYLNTLFMDYDTYLDGPVKDGVCIPSNLQKRYSIDYPSMNMANLAGINETIKEQKKLAAGNGLRFSFPAEEILVEYESRASQLRMILWLIQIPVMLMIVFYLFMVSQLNVEQEKNEIAVFKSRGASSGQIFLIYALESLLLGLFTAVIGPFVALLLCRMLGASNGFLEFVNRKALPITLTADAFVYSLLAVVVFFITTMTPIVPAAKMSIVAHKQSKAKKKKRPLWEKLFLDVILLGGSIGWLYYYHYEQENLLDMGVTNSSGTINPMLFVASTAFILGAALLIVRIYPLIIRLIYNIGKRFWSPAAYVSLNNIGRSSTGRERFLMVFLVLTVSLGIFFANTARALNRNAEEKVQYSIGCDAVISESWRSESASVLDESTGENVSVTNYIEPTFERFTAIPQIEAAAKVLKSSAVTISGDNIERQVKDNISGGWGDRQNTRVVNSVGGCNVMAIQPGEFAKVVSSIDRLLPSHINTYLNGLNDSPSGIILSSSFRDNYGVKLGDVVEVKTDWEGATFEATVIAFAEYWPSMNPYKQKEDGSYVDFAVLNYDYVQVHSSTPYPYEVWTKLEDGSTTADLYASIEESEIEPIDIKVAAQEIISAKNDPMLQGLNGALTLGFIIIMIMCLIGFLIYWILSIKSRTLQFGILRAMGMSFREIIALIVYEQILVSGVAIVVSFVIGYYASVLYIPLFESLYDAAEMVPALAVIPLRSDYVKIYVVIGAMLLLGFGVLARLISKINISKALKLGEE